ncbi:hypothetical protein JOC77_003733 [Peribacillus deserti]|uniref:SbsA Ig-like domain-containing protein n=1 Tax=Peribacillus deserti TaxID=673318 RepID=A0ABS2QMD8_9BACI|nr:hypothetical protein [Peribacillus deserti]MBM7694272.1 hypothetical protein [Peribacillus deserti]
MKKRIIALTAFGIIGIGSLISYPQIFNEKQHSSIKVSQENIATASMNQSDIPLNQEWVITYDNGLNRDIISEKSIYVIDDDNNKVPVKVNVEDSNNLLIKPPSEGYLQGKSYDLYLDRDLDLENDGNENLPYQYHFSTINNL